MKPVNVVIIISSIMILAMGSLLRINNLNNVAFRTPDENTYTYQATEIAEHGTEGLKSLIRAYNTEAKNWILPSPIRIGYIYPLALAMKAANIFNDAKVGAYLSCIFSICGLGILIILGLRFFNPYITLFGIISLSVSPMDLVIARRAWQDSMLGVLALALIYVSCEITRSGRKAAWYVVFIFLGSYCILIKESGLGIYLLCFLWILSVLVVRKKFLPDGLIFIAAGILGALTSFSILAYAAGGFNVVLEALKHHLGSIPTNWYALKYQTGPWYNLLLGLWILSPAYLVLCFIGIVTTLIRGTPATRGMTFFMIIFFVLTTLTPHCQNLRYLSVLYAPFYLMAGAGLWYMLMLCKNGKNRAYFISVTTLVSAIIVVSAIRDYKTFIDIFVNMGVFDLSVNLLK